MDKRLIKLIEKEGGIFEFDSFHHDSVKLFFDLVQDKFTFNQVFAKNLLKDDSAVPNVFFINSIESVAYADTFIGETGNRVDYIFIFAGLPFALLNIFLRILSQPTSFVDIGDHSKELLDQNDKVRIYDILENPNQITVFPRCKVREYYAMELAKSTLDFIFCHELAHLFRGHCDYLKSNKRHMRLPHDTDVNHKLDDIILLYQAIEFDADLIGLKVHWNLISSIGKNFSYFKKNNLGGDHYTALSNIYNHPSLSFRVLTICSYTFFRVYAENWRPELKLFDRGAKEHPDSIIRMIYILSDFFSTQNPVPFDDDVVVQWNKSSAFFKNYVINILEAERNFAFIQGDEIDLRPLLYTIFEHQNELDSYLNELILNRSKLIPELTPFMR